MGNGPGDVFEYIKRMRKYKNFIGGCIWEWADHTVIEDSVQKYGGDFGELTHDGNFCCDGLVFSDRSFKAGSYHTKYSYQNYDTELENGKLKISNYFDFTNLNNYKLTVRVTCDGKTLEEKKLTIDLEPHGEAYVDFEIKAPESCIYGAFVETELKDKKGKVIGISQHKLDVPLISLESKSPVKLIREAEGKFYIEGADFSYVVNKRHGFFESIKKNGKEQLMAESCLSVWRAPTDNDRHVKNRWGLFENNAAAVNMNRLFSKIYSCEKDGNKILIKGSLAGVARAPFLKYTSEYEFFADGTIKVSLSADVEDWVDIFAEIRL